MPNWTQDSYNDPESDQPEDVGETKWENDNTGGRVRVTRYRDGSSVVHWGGMGGDQHFDRNGES